jgi:hypothetical protein
MAATWYNEYANCWLCCNGAHFINETKLICFFDKEIEYINKLFHQLYNNTIVEKPVKMLGNEVFSGYQNKRARLTVRQPSIFLLIDFL